MSGNISCKGRAIRIILFRIHMMKNKLHGRTIFYSPASWRRPDDLLQPGLLEVFIMRVAKTYRFKSETVDQLETVRAMLEEKLGMKVSATAAIEYLINNYYRENS